MAKKQTKALRIDALKIAASLGDKTGQISFHSSHLFSLIEGYNAARQEIASLKAQPYDQQAMGLCHVCGWKGVIDYPDGPVCVACEHDKMLSPQPAAQAQPVTVPWENFPSYLIDHCEGDVISEEGLQFALSKMLSNPQYAPQPAAQTQTQEDVGGWRRAGALLYRLTGEHRPTNFDEIRVTMANGSRDIGQMSVQAERLLVMLTAPQPAAQAQEDVPDMFWDADDTENFAHEIQDIIDGYGPGEIVTIECAKRLPNLRVVVTRDGDGLSYEYLEAAIVAQEGGAHG